MLKRPMVLDPAKHLQLSCRPLKNGLHSAGLTLCPLLPAELSLVLSDYVIVFDQDNGYRPCLLLGRAGNGYLKPDGTWAARHLPGYLRCYPFALAPGKQGKPQLAFDAASALLGTTAGSRLFKEDGSPSEYHLNQLRALEVQEQQLANARALGSALHRHGLLAEADLALDGDAAQGAQPTCYWVYQPDKLPLLPAEALLHLHKTRALELALAQLASLANLAVGRPARDLILRSAGTRQAMSTAQAPLAAEESKRFSSVMAMEQQGKVREALCELTKLLKQNPKEARFHKLHADIHVARGDFNAALQALDEAVRVIPDDLSLRHAKARMLLRLERFSEGWEQFSVRVDEERLAKPQLPVWRIPPWQPDAGKQSLLVWREQGVGEDLFFGSMLADAERLAPEVHAIVDMRLLPLFQRSLPGFRFVTGDAKLSVEDFDSQMMMGDLARYLRPTRELIQQQAGAYLKVDAERAAKLRARLSPADGRLLVGVAWKSTRINDGELNAAKSLGLEQLRPLLSLPNCSFVNLQYGDVDTDLDALETRTGLHIDNSHGIDLFHDLDGLAALLAACDYVVTPSSVTALLAGAIGKHSWVLLPKGAMRMWFWHTGDGPNLWFPALQQVSQGQAGDWTAPISKVCQALCERRT